MTRALRVGAVVTLVAVLALLGAPEARAVTPPAVDDALLPAPRPASPPTRTEQTEACVPGAAAVERTGAGQLDALDLQAVWPLTRGAGQTIAVIDTGVARHRLLPRLVAGGDYVSTGDGTDDCDGHGTIVAGILAATPDGPGKFSGIAPDATIIGIRQSSTRFRAADAAGPGGFGDVRTLAQAVRTAADLGATVINVSTVACVDAATGLDDRELGAALAYAVDVRGAVVVAAAGNVGAPGQCPEQNPTTPGRPDWSGVRAVASPAWYDDHVLTVGSVGPDGQPSAFTAAGPWVDVAAPGEQVVSLDRDGEGLVATAPDGEKPLAGTSYAAPVVAGVAALVRARFPALTARQVMQRIEQTARHPAAGWDPLVGHGVVDPVAAVTGGATSDDEPPRRFVAAPEAPAGEPPDRTAVVGAALCLAVVTALAAVPLWRRPAR
ncbi:type VII secretion-associated serine protease mycosin [Mycolicibacterium phlei]